MCHGDESNSPMLKVIGLDLKATNSDLYELFKPYGEVIWCEIRKDKLTRRHLGSGFVSFIDPNHVTKAVRALDFEAYKGQTLHLAPYKSPFNSLIVVLELNDASEDDLSTTFGQFGPLAWTRLNEHEQGEYHFFVTFANHQGAAKAATALRQKKLPCMYLSSKQVADPHVPFDTTVRGFVHDEEVQQFQGVNVRVNNLDPRISNLQLKNMFSPYGTISSCQLGFVLFLFVYIAAMNGKRIFRYAIEVALEDGGKRASRYAIEVALEDRGKRASSETPLVATMAGAWW